ncbi:M15 family metallopeptidase [Pseudomarimonas arenosa]|uniref:M15 family metallopeptidase n=1 Tax=Pseudomarimonas arenosa TaxID=2774145 RepID=A0AAW3ZKK5_9GAMM|nr:M15 family metallopeptidase [Pseudomarimonas arenosa]MBD8526668.1 M15 family metallopeptidase [Pseudomarimonas arenosa]
MSHVPVHLLNADHLDAVPAHALNARRNDHNRALRHAQYLIRRKQDGRYLGLIGRWNGMLQFRAWQDRSCSVEQLDPLLAMLGLRRRDALHGRRPIRLAQLPNWQLALPGVGNVLLDWLDRLNAMGIDALAYSESTGLPWQFEPPILRYAGRDRFQRPLWLIDSAAKSWARMRRAAAADDVTLDAISGFRGYAYQYGIFQRKLARGLSIEQILKVNAAPGFSEHHTGRALDIGFPGEPSAEESFEHTPAYAWLDQHANEFGFHLSYPRNNPHGISFEPWHWCWHAALPM